MRWTGNNSRKACLINQGAPPAQHWEICQGKPHNTSSVHPMSKRAFLTAKNGTTGSADTVVCVDLFCGAGGLTSGLRDAGIDVVAGVDFDAACKYPYTANHKGIVFEQADVAKLDASVVARWFGDAKVRVLAGCAPCQPFSSYAQRYQTVGTERWSLLYHFSRLVTELLPDVVTMENVPTVTKHTVFNDFVKTLRKHGYEDPWIKVIDCSDYGLPQRRRRTVLLASRLGSISLIPPTRKTTRTVADVLSGLPPLSHGERDAADPLHAASGLSPLNLQRIIASKPGGTWRDWQDASLVAECHRKDSGKTYPGVYGRMTWNDPSPTLTTQFYGFGNGRFGHPDQNRGLSLREGAILQGFPTKYKFVRPGEPVQFKTLGRLIGNAVPVDLGRVIGESIIAHVRENAGQLSPSHQNHPINKRARSA